MVKWRTKIVVWSRSVRWLEVEFDGPGYDPRSLRRTENVFDDAADSRHGETLDEEVNDWYLLDPKDWERVEDGGEDVDRPK